VVTATLEVVCGEEADETGANSANALHEYLPLVLLNPGVSLPKKSNW
jgi:hypothetical protein